MSTDAPKCRSTFLLTNEISQHHDGENKDDALNDNLSSRSLTDFSQNSAAKSVGKDSPASSNFSLVQNQVRESSDQLPLLKMIVLSISSVIVLNLLPHLALQKHIYVSDKKVMSKVPADDTNTIYQQAAPPERFFPWDSVVHDFYYGEIDPAIELLKEHDFVFVMFYAHWSHSSIIARNEFEKAAYVMRTRVPFIAINCWLESSQCWTKYKFYSYPSFYAYADGLNTGFTYSGVEKAEYFVRFMESLLNPLTHIHNTSELLNFVANQDSSLVGYFNLSSSAPQDRFQQFYYASLRSIESDFIQPVRFGVLSDEKFASEYSINEISPLLLVRSIDENLVYPSTNNFTSTAITKWIDKNRIKPLVRWYFPTGKKSTDLFTVLKSGPTAILFTRFDACSLYNRDVTLLREVALSYSACNISVYSPKHAKILSVIDASTSYRRLQPDYSLCIECPTQTGNTHCCYSLHVHSSVCQLCFPQSPCSGHCRECIRAISHLNSVQSSFIENQTCYDMTTKNYGFAKSKLCCERLRRLTDDYVSRHIHCTRNKSSLSSLINDSYLSDKEFDWKDTICSSNATVNFLAVDSQLYKDYLNRLGGQIGAVNTQLVLVDLTNESHFLFKDPFSKSNIVRFLEDQKLGMLGRDYFYTRSELEHTSSDLTRHFTVKDLDAPAFIQLLDQVKIKQQDVVIFFYAKWCLHCKSVNHMYLNAAKYLSSQSNIQFYKMDVTSNALPWKYTTNRVPCILISSYRYGHEIMSPSDHISAAQISKFVLTHCSQEHFIKLMSKISADSNKAVIIRSMIATMQRKLMDIHLANGHANLSEFIELNKKTTIIRLMFLQRLYRYVYGNHFRWNTSFEYLESLYFVFSKTLT